MRNRFHWRIPLALGFALVPLAISIQAGCGSGGKGDGGTGGVPDSGGIPDGGSGTGTATVSGTVDGGSLTPVSTLGYATVVTCPDAGSVAFAFSGIADFVASCTSLQSDKANSTTLGMFVLRFGQQTQQPIAPGTYSVSVGFPTPDDAGVISFVSATFEKLGAACQRTVSSDATSGTIVISSVSSTSIAGTFDLTFGGGRLTGTFNSPICSIPEAIICQDLTPSDAGTPDAGCVP
jgi:hypothetical protein